VQFWVTGQKSSGNTVLIVANIDDRDAGVIYDETKTITKTKTV